MIPSLIRISHWRSAFICQKGGKSEVPGGLPPSALPFITFSNICAWLPWHGVEGYDEMHSQPNHDEVELSILQDAGLHKQQGGNHTGPCVAPIHLGFPGTCDQNQCTVAPTGRCHLHPPLPLIRKRKNVTNSISCFNAYKPHSQNCGAFQMEL